MSYTTPYRAGGECVRLVKDVNSENDYIDEYGINRGTGITINGVTWAPVNCGYISPGEIDKDGHQYIIGYPYGKYYQFGRKTGVGFVDKKRPYTSGGTDYIYCDENYPDYFVDQFTGTDGEGDSANEEYFFMAQNWTRTETNILKLYWNSGSETTPVKTEFDPCPSGWRVPTSAELAKLVAKNKTYNYGNSCYNVTKTCKITDDTNVTGLRVA